MTTDTYDPSDDGCPLCEGDNEIRCPDCDGDGCDACHGDGWIACPDCGPREEVEP